MSGTLDVRASADGVRIGVRVMPRSSRTAIEGVRDGRLLMRVTAPPVDRAANDAAIAALADALDLPRASVRLIAGATSRTKTIAIAGLTEAELRARLNL